MSEPGQIPYAVPSKRDDEVFTWESQAIQYPPNGEPGISHYRAELAPDVYVDCLLYRDDDGSLIGIFNFFPEGVPGLEQPRTAAVFVHPDHRRKGIATALMQERLARWSGRAPEGALRMTESGAAFLNSQIRRFNATGEYPNYDPARHGSPPLDVDATPWPSRPAEEPQMDTDQE